MKKLLIGAAMAVSMLAAAPVAANAATYVTLPPAASDGSLTGSFSKENVGLGAFSHEYTFNFPAAGWASTYVSSIKAKLNSTNIDFTSISLNGNPFTIVNGIFSVSLNTINDPTRHVQYGFEVIGPDVWSTDVGNYGNIQVAAVPEPSSLGLLLLGAAGAFAGFKRRK